MSKELDSAMREALIEVSTAQKIKKLAVASDFTLKKGTKMVTLSYYQDGKIVIEPLLIWTS